MAILKVDWSTNHDAHNLFRLNNLLDGVAPKDAVNLSQLTALTQSDSWQQPIKDQVDFTTAEPVAPSVGDRYINTVAGVSNVTAQAVAANAIYEWNGVDWTETLAVDGMATYDQAADDIYTFNGTSWIASHGTYVTDYFVSSDIGNDSNDGLNQTRPFATLGACLDAVETAAVAAAIHILDDNSYTVTESSGTPGTRDLGVECSITFPHATLIGQGGGVDWNIGAFFLKGKKVDGTNLVFEPASSGAKAFYIQSIQNPNYLFVPTKGGAGSVGAVSVLCDTIGGIGGIADYETSRTGILRLTCVGNISTVTADASRIYDFKVSGSGNAISVVTWNYDSRNSGAGDFVPIRVTSDGRAWYHLDCIGSAVAGVIEIDGASSDAYGHASTAGSGAPLTILGTNPERAHDWSWTQGLNFSKLGTGTLTLTDIINVRSSGSQRQFTISELQTLIIGAASCKALQTSGIWSGSGQPISTSGTRSATWVWWDSEEFDTASMHDVSLDYTGTATGVHTGTTLQDTSQSWTVNELTDKFIRITGGTNIDDVVKIVSNTADTITVDASWITTVDNTSTYEISEAPTIVIPSAGKYTLTSIINFSASSVGLRGIQLWKNGGFLDTIYANPVGTIESAVAWPSMPYSFLANDRLEVKAYNSSGITLTFNAGRLRFAVQKISE